MENQLEQLCLLGIYCEIGCQTEILLNEKLYMNNVLSKNDYISALNNAKKKLEYEKSMIQQVLTGEKEDEKEDKEKKSE